MKKALGLLMALIFAVLAFSGTANAESLYVIEKGNCLSKIAQKLDVSMKEITKVNPHIRNINKIYAGQIIQIPDGNDEFSYEHPGADKFRGTLDEALKLLGFPEDVAKALKEKVTNGVFDWHDEKNWYDIKIGDRFAMTFGKNKVKFNTIANWKDQTKLLAAKKYEVTVDDIEYTLLYPLACGNWSQLKIEIKPPVPPTIPQPPIEVTPPPPTIPQPPTEITPPPPTIPQPPIEVTPPPVFEEKPTSRRDKFDWYIGGGNYSSSHPDQSANGYYYWSKIRARPLWMNVGEKTELGLGIFAFGAGGAGNSEDFRYNWNEGVIGVTGKLVGNNYDADLDVGWGYLKNWGGVDSYRSYQNEKITLISSHLNEYSRRDAGVKLFPKKEFNVELRLTDHTRHKHSWQGERLKSEPFNNNSLNLSYTQWIYDFEPNSHTRITPGWNFGGGREYGIHKNYLQTGPAVVFSSYNEDIIQLSVFNYKEQLRGEGDQWHWISGWISLDGAYRAIRASQMHKTTPEELKARAVKINTTNDDNVIKLSDFD